ncbi:MAG TPA: MFS transporter [Burkholderiales bacterium]|jgi:ATP-dependent protease HslVU (ClpYQ) peptidase subunit|nr:MFS transporter [Burkholderiales bacterium]
MTTIAVVRKNGYAAIAADTMTKWGTGKETAEYIINHSKILKVGSSYIGVTGSATFKTILEDYFGRSRAYARFDTPFEIFKTWHKLHAALKQEYYLITGHSEEDVLESSRMDALIANARGIFGVAAHRTVQEFSKFYAFGSGGDFAMGSMHSTYAEAGRSAESVARAAIEAAAEFDDSTGLPVNSFTVKLARR